ncbi:MAG: hypothetical protein WC718_02085 [Phycisphaerales bacterium]|jgi:protein ImuA
MRSKTPLATLRKPAASIAPEALGELAERLRAIEGRGIVTDTPITPTGWREVDAALPDGGLRAGGLHEWCGLNGEGPRDAGWTPPLVVLAHLARRAIDAPRPRWSVWIGRRTWMYGHQAARTLGNIDQVLWVDPPDAASRLWAMEAALRCPGLVVVADGAGFDAAASRRLQLAAASTGTLGLLVRPLSELHAISFSLSRWSVRTCPGGGRHGRWLVNLVRCKGLHAGESPGWTLERTPDGCLGCLSPLAAHRPHTAAAAS